jgi:hypothetical protein
MTDASANPQKKIQSKIFFAFFQRLHVVTESPFFHEKWPSKNGQGVGFGNTESHILI